MGTATGPGGELGVALEKKRGAKNRMKGIGIVNKDCVWKKDFMTQIEAKERKVETATFEREKAIILLPNLMLVLCFLLGCC